jgi:PhzF family phenazine biosynthesis protein
MKLLQYDAFTGRAFCGNPAAVCLLDAFPPDRWMQNVAGEMNLSETAFVVRRGGARFGLRWFTPTVEVDLCGHATLASACAIWEEGSVAEGEMLTFETRSGELRAELERSCIWLDFPSTPARPSEEVEGLREALGVPVVWMGRNGFDVLVEVRSAATVRDLRPDLTRLRDVEMRGLIVTARADNDAPGADFVSRFFAPSAGVDEDPVTGSAHCTLGPHWSRRLQRDDLVGVQMSRRGGTVRVRVRGDRVHLGGHAVRTAEIVLAEAAVEGHGG